MSERNERRVVPFALSAYRMRKSADAYRKRGQMVEALELTRRAALQEDTATGWLRLARELRMAGCCEQAATILYRLCGWEHPLPEVWLELGRCLSQLGRRDSACDCLYHYLHEDPYSEAADQARDMLSELEEVQQMKQPFRLPLLIRRGLMCYRRHETALGDRRLDRALRLGGDKAKLYSIRATLALGHDQPRQALQEIARALHTAPDDPKLLAIAAVALSHLGKPRMARGMLMQCSQHIRTPEELVQLQGVAWGLNANDIVLQHLEKQLRLQPCCITLIHPLAYLLWHTGEQEMALKWWKRILAIDPDDVQARALLTWASEHQDSELPPPGALPGDFMQKQASLLLELISSNLSTEEALRPGAQSRQLLDWCFSMADAPLQQAAFGFLLRQHEPCVQRYLHELLTLPRTRQDIRQRAMLALALMGDSGPMNVNIGGRISTAQLSPVKDTRQNLWAVFLPLLLKETRTTCHATEIAFFAADLWAVMTPAQRHDAAGAQHFLWIKALEILYLRLTGQDDTAAQIVQALPVSARKISRIMRTLKQQTDASLNIDAMTDEMEGDET